MEQLYCTVLACVDMFHNIVMEENCVLIFATAVKILVITKVSNVNAHAQRAKQPTAARLSDLLIGRNCDLLPVTIAMVTGTQIAQISQPKAGTHNLNNYTILYYTTLHYTILYYTILYYTMQYNTTLCYTILYHTMLYYSTLYNTTLYYTILYYTIQYYTILFYTIRIC